MRIGIDTSAVGEKYTGTGRYIDCVLEQLLNTGNEIVTFSPSKHEIYGNTKKNLSDLFSLGHGGLKRHLYRQFRLSKEMNSADVEYGIFPNYFMPARFDKTSAIVIHDLSFITHPQFYSKPFVLYYTNQLKNTLKNNPAVITVSQHSRQQVHHHLGVKIDDIMLVQAYSNIIDNPIDLCGGKMDKPYLLYVGHVEPKKNLPFLVENFWEWKKSRNVEMKLVIAGEIWIKSASINKLLKKYLHNGYIEFTGYVDEEKLKELYAGASGFVHTSFVEGFGLPVLEAMHYGLPIICSEGTGTEEISGFESIKINPYENKSMLSGLDKLYEKILTTGKVDYDIKYSPELTCLQLLGVIERLECKALRIIPSFHFQPRSTEEAIEKTLLYASLFNSGIKKKHLLTSLFDLKTSGRNLEFALMNLYRSNKVLIKDDAVFSNEGEKDFYKMKKENSNLDRSKKFLNMLSKLPLISSISFSGGTAHYGLNLHDDVDLFIITKPHCIYPVYALIHLFSLLLGVRKEICANYLIDEKNMEIFLQRDYYTAHQIISLAPYRNKNVLEHFLDMNKWVKYFYPNFRTKNIPMDSASKFYALLSPINNFIMFFYKALYTNLLSRKNGNGSLVISAHCLKLHTNDHRERVTKKFDDEWRRYCEKNNYEDVEEEGLQKPVEVNLPDYSTSNITAKIRIGA